MTKKNSPLANESYNIPLNNPKKSESVLIIPILNEENSIHPQLTRIVQHNYDIDIIIVDGGSTDNSLGSIASLASLKSIVVCTTKRGLTGQLQVGFYLALESGYKNIVTMDGNNKDDETGIPVILSALQKENVDFVQGSRFVTGGRAINNPKLRLFAIRVIHAPITSLFAKQHYSDTTNGFRGFSANFLRRNLDLVLNLNLKNYDLVTLIPLIAGKRQFKVKEVGVIRSYPKGIKTPTKIIGWKAHIHLFFTLLKLGIYTWRNFKKL